LLRPEAEASQTFTEVWVWNSLFC